VRSRQLDPGEYLVQSGARVKRDDEHYYIPDLAVVPVSPINPNREQWRGLNLFHLDQPLPLVVKIWSSSTGPVDDNDKLPFYRRRGDREIWRLRPYDQTVIVWRRQPDGTYTEASHRSGRLSLYGLPDVVIDLDALFA
jgi:Uma2 family endonuclease